MPQLDIFSWFDQVFNLFSIICGSYFIFNFFFLSGSMELFKSRNKILNLRVLARLIIDLKVLVNFKYIQMFFFCLTSIFFYSLRFIYNFGSVKLINNWIYNYLFYTNINSRDDRFDDFFVAAEYLKAVEFNIVPYFDLIK